MRLLNLNRLFLVVFILIFSQPLFSEEPIDIWKKEEKQNSKKTNKQKDINIENSNTTDEKIKISDNIKMLNNISDPELENKLFGIIDPEDNNFSLNMWVKSDGKDLVKIFKRINKLKLSSSAENIFINTIITYSYPPTSNISDKEFKNLKINWLINNSKDKLLEKLLNNNKEFDHKKKIIQYLVDKNIAKADLNEGCKKSSFISKDIKDPYLEKFKIYCLIFNNKKNEAQLVYDILKEQNLSDKFFDDKINFLLGISDNTNNKIKDDTLLNFYLSSITVPNFSYEPTKKTNKYIWEYLNSANLIKINDIEDKEKISNLEKAANDNTFDKEKIFEAYKKFSFDLNNLINAKDVYQSLDGIESRALIYQKYLLSDNLENKLKLLGLLKNLFKKDKISNVFTKFMSDELKNFKELDIPEAYKQFVKNNIISEEEYKLGRIKYDDKIFHRSRVIRYYTESDTPFQKSQKDISNVYKKIKKNKKYFFSAKDLALVESLKKDGFEIPKEIDAKKISKKYNIPEGLKNLQKNGEIGLFTLKVVEIIGEDEVYDLDSETIYFIVNLLNQANLKNFRNKILISALPFRE